MVQMRAQVQGDRIPAVLEALAQVSARRRQRRQAPLSLVTGRPAPRLTLAEAEQLAAQPIDSLY